MPPVNNKGADFTPAPVAPSGNRVLIDWLGFTIQDRNPVEVLRSLGFDTGLFSEMNGGMGYRRSLRFGNICCFFDGGENMGCHISITGSGCREYENLNFSLGPDCWFYLISDAITAGATFSRIDIAMDNVDGQLSMDRVNSAVASGEYRSKFRTTNYTDSQRLSRDDPGPIGKTRYFGQLKSSRVCVRFYDKAAEQESKHKLDAGTLGHWVRCEVVIKEQRADEAAKHLVSGLEPSQLAVGVLNNYLSIIELDDTNISRCSLQKWWSDWLQSAEKIKLTTQKAMKTINHCRQHLINQYSATIAMIRKYDGVARFRSFVLDLLAEGEHKMNNRHKKILQYSGYGSVALDAPF